MATSIGRAISISGVVLVFLILAGATYQGTATALERHRYPHPGRLVPAGDHQLHIYCTGRGTPTVVLEAPATGLSASWGLLQPILEARTRVCSYDRAGLGWSEWGNEEFGATVAADQLHALLDNAGEHPPYVLAGEGFGAALARVSAARFPGNIPGLVTIDEPEGAVEPQVGPRVARMAMLSPWLARTGVLRLARLFTPRAGDLPEPAGGALRSFLLRPDHLTRSWRELSQWNDTMTIARAAQLPDETIVVRVDAGGGDRTAMLTSPSDARTAAEAILAVVNRLRPRADD